MLARRSLARVASARTALPRPQGVRSLSSVGNHSRIGVLASVTITTTGLGVAAAAAAKYNPALADGVVPSSLDEFKAMLFGGEEAVEEVVEEFTVEDLLGKPKAEEAEAKPSMARVDKEARPPTHEGEVAVAKGIEEEVNAQLAEEEAAAVAEGRDPFASQVAECDGAAECSPAECSGALIDEPSYINSGSTLVGTGPRKSPGPRPTDDFAQAGKLDGKEVLEAKAAAKVEVPIDEADLAQLPLMSLDELRSSGSSEGMAKLPDEKEERMYATYEGVVYDLTEFADQHPGGRELLVAAKGLDLGHFFENYTVHTQSGKAARWLAPLAVGRLSTADALRSREESGPEAHVRSRMQLLGRARRKLLLVTASLPAWLTVRAFVRMVGWVLPSLGRAIASILPVAVPGYSRGAECAPEGASVVVIGGGIAGVGAAWNLAESGFKVTVFEARQQCSGNARTFDWHGYEDGAFDNDTVKSCVSVTAWPPIFYKNYTALLDRIGVETVPMPLSWFLNSKVEGCEGTLWAADPSAPDGSLRKRFAKDFARYDMVQRFVSSTTDFFTGTWMPWKWNDMPSMYANHTGFGMLNPFNTYPLYNCFRMVGGSQEWWDIVFTPMYTASFLVDELRPFPAVFGPLIEAQIPLIPHKNDGRTFNGPTKKDSDDCNITTCVTWKDAGKGMRDVFARLTEKVDVKTATRVVDVKVLPNGKKLVRDEYDNVMEVDRVIFACPSNAVGNILKDHGPLEDTILSAPVYADDHHPSTGHMHAVMHSDGSVIDEKYRDTILTRASNYVEITKNKSDGHINIENQYNFGVQTPGPGVFDMPLEKKPVMLISHALGEGKSIDDKLVRGTANHARAHPLYSGWNVAAMLSLRLVQGKDGVYYCANWTTPGNCHDMSLLSGFVVANACGAKYPFPESAARDKTEKKWFNECYKDFNRMRDLMGVSHGGVRPDLH